MNLIKAYRDFGKRGAKLYMRSMWAPSTYSSDRRRNERMSFKSHRGAWGRSVSSAMGKRDLRVLAQLMSSIPPTAHPPSAATNMLSNNDYRRCAESGVWTRCDDMIYLRSTDEWISRALANTIGIHWCQRCDQGFRGGDDHPVTQDTHVSYCGRRCAEAHGCVRGNDGAWYSSLAAAPPIYIYRYNETFVGPVGTQDSYPLGIEMEIEFPSEAGRIEFAKEAHKRYGREVAHCKHDGSLSSRGVEVITGYGPYTDIAPIACDLAQVARTLGGKSHETDTCGTHISVGRSEMSLAQQARFVVFFNHPDNQSFIKTFARRTSSRYAATVPSKSSDAFITRCSADFDYLFGDKYEAVNCNHRTHLEVRVFRGSLNSNTIMARLSLVRMVGEWCEGDLSAKDLVYTQFLKHIKNKPDCQMFKSIEQYLKRRGRSNLLLEEATC